MIVNADGDWLRDVDHALVEGQGVSRSARVLAAADGGNGARRGRGRSAGTFSSARGLDAAPASGNELGIDAI